MAGKRIDPAKLKRGSVRHAELPLALVARINYLHSSLFEVYPQSMAEWLDAFKRDAHPESEVIWWERLALLYLTYSEEKDLNAEQKQALFKILFKIGMGSDVQAQDAELARLPKGALSEILAMTRERMQ